MHLAFFKASHLGDNLVFLPVVQEWRRRRPAWKLTVLTAPHTAALYSSDVAAEDLLTAAPEELKFAWRRPWLFARWAARLRARRIGASLVSYDQTSVVHGLARLAGGPIRVGAAGLEVRLRGTMTREVPAPPAGSAAQWNWEMARALAEETGAADDWPAEPVAPDLSHLTGGVPRCAGRVVIHAGSKQAYTRWPLDRYAELAGRLAREHEVWWIDAPENRGVTLAAGVTRRASPDLPTLVQLLAGAALFVGNNSGPMHLADALGTPAVIVCGPSSPIWDPTWHRDRIQLLRTPHLACLPCDRGIFAANQCAHATEPLACMTRWSVDALEATCRAALVRHTRS